MGKVWMFEETGEGRIAKEEWIWLSGGPVKIRGRSPFEYPILKLTEYPSNPITQVKEKLESITCLAAEGPEAESHAKLFDAIFKEALQAIEILEGK